MMKQSFEAGKSVAAGKMYFLSGVFYGAKGKVYLPMTKCLTRRIRRRRVDELRNKFADGKLGQAAKPVVFSDTIRAACKRCAAGVQQVNNAVQEVNYLARKNKDSIEGLAEEVGNFIL